MELIILEYLQETLRFDINSQSLKDYVKRNLKAIPSSEWKSIRLGEYNIQTE